MKGFILTFALGAAAGAFGFWYFTQGQGKDQFAEVQTNAMRVGEIVRTKASEGYQDVMDELARTGMIVRDKSCGLGANFCVNFTVHLFVRGSRTFRKRSRDPVM